MRHRSRDGPRKPIQAPLSKLARWRLASRTSLSRSTTSDGDRVVGRAEGIEQGRELTSGASAR